MERVLVCQCDVMCPHSWCDHWQRAAPRPWRGRGRPPASAAAAGPARRGRPPACAVWGRGRLEAGGWGQERSVPGAGVERGDQHQQQDEAAQHGDQAEAGQRGGEAGAGGHQLQLAPVQICNIVWRSLDIEAGHLRPVWPGLQLHTGCTTPAATVTTRHTPEWRQYLGSVDIDIYIGGCTLYLCRYLHLHIVRCLAIIYRC